MRALRVFLAGAALLTGFVAFSPPASASKSVGNCTITAIQPEPVSLAASGTRQSAGQGTVRCSTNRTVQVQVLLYGADEFRNDLLANSSWIGTAGSGGVTIRSARVNCNEDVGGDELFSQARVRIYTNGIWSTWSAIDQSPTYAFNC